MGTGRAHTCGMCRNRVPALNPQGICPRCEKQLAPVDGEPWDRSRRGRRRRAQEKKFERTIPRTARRR